MLKFGEHPAYPFLDYQNFEQYNRGDMYVPAGMVRAPLYAAALATPFIGIMNVHPVPVTYLTTKADIRPMNEIGMATPANARVGVAL